MTQYSIVVDVRQPRNTIFIARPFSSDFDDIRTAVLLAVTGVPDYSASGTDLNPENVSFKADIVKKIREARAVIAVCSQELKTQKPNPNVMYELGFARSIGKPSVVLMREGEVLPADLQGDQVLFYQQGKENGIVSDLTSALNRQLNNSKNTRLIDEVSYSPEIWVASAHHWLILKPNLWKDFLTILNFAKAIHTLFFDLYSSHLSSLHAAVETLYTGAVVPAALATKKAECTSKWINYIHRYDTAENDFLRSIIRTQEDVDETRKELEDNTTDASTKNILASVQNYLNTINEQLASFSKTHEDIVSAIPKKGGFNSIFDAQSHIEEIWGLLGSLSDACHGLTSNADSLIMELTELLFVTERKNT